MVSSFSSISPAAPVISILVEAVVVVKAPVDAELAPMVVPSIAPASMSTLLISTSPVPLGERVMFPFTPSVIVMLPEVEFPVFKVTSWFPFDLKTPSVLPSPATTTPFIITAPSKVLVMVSLFSRFMPAA